MRKIIDAGHGGRDPGATFRGLKEKDITLAVGKKVNWMMAEFNVFMTRTTDIYLTLQERCDFANNMGADYFLSIHCNADPDPDKPGMPEAKGEEFWIYKNSQKGRQYGERIKKYIDLIFWDEPFRGIKETDGMKVLWGTKMPSGLVEIGFIDNSNTWRQLQDSAVITEIACCIVLGLLRI